MQFFLVQPEKIAVLGISDPYGGELRCTDIAVMKLLIL